MRSERQTLQSCFLMVVRGLGSLGSPRKLTGIALGPAPELFWLPSPTLTGSRMNRTTPRLSRMVKETFHHPQQLTHELSLLRSKQESLCHLPADVAVDGAADSGLNSTGQAFWLNAARSIDWFQRPKLAYGPSQGSEVRDARQLVPSGAREL